ncbi:2132_t:CDS:2, partial [Cetraspora pellucida]
RARKEAERLAEEQALRAEREKKAEEERKKREEERLRKEAERRAREEEQQEAKERKEREERERKDREEKARKEKEEKERRQRDERDRKEREAKERREREARERKENEENERKERELREQEKVRKEKEEKERREREEKDRKDKEEKEQRAVALPSTRQHLERKRTIPPIGQPSVQQSQPPINNQPAVQSKNVATMSNGAINWTNYTLHESHQTIPPHHAINQPHSVNHHMPPPPNHPPHPIFSQNGPQPQFGGQPGGIINGPVGMNNEIVNDVYTNNKKILNQPPQQPTNTLPGMNPASSLFATGLGPIGMGVHPHHGGPPMPIHAHHPAMRQQIPPRGFNPIGAAPHLTGPAAGVPPSVASTNLSLLNEPVIGGNGNIGTGVNTNPPPGAFGGLPLGGGQGPLGPQTFNLGTQVVGQPTPSSHIGPNVVQNAPLAPIGHRRMSQHPDDPHIKAVHRPQPIQRPSRRESVTTHTSLDTRTRSPPPGFGNMVGSGALTGDDQSHPMTNRRQSLATAESSYFSNSLFSSLPGETSQQSQSSQNQQPQHQLGSSRLTHRSVGDNEWPPIRRSGGTDNISDTVSINSSNNIGASNPDIWSLNSVNWYQEGNNNANRRVMGSSKDFGIP